MTSNTYNPFRLPLKNRVLAALAERFLGLMPLVQAYERRPPAIKTTGFLDYTLSSLGIQIENDAAADICARIRPQGPLLVVANHPLGAVECVALARALLAVRSDVKVMTNELLTRIPELKDIFIGVDVLSADASRKNARGIREASQHLKSGGVLLLFPAGMVSAVNVRNRRIEDRPWNRLAGVLAKKHNAACLPIYVKGRNSRLFYLAGMLHARLRTVLLPRELANKSGAAISFVVGDVIASNELVHFQDDLSLTRYLRLNTDLLGAAAPTAGDADGATSSQNPSAVDSPDIESSKKANLAALIEGLAEYQLENKADCSVYCVPYVAMGELMQHLGEVRELTFRAAGEGTGKSADVDRYDPLYQHLFVWDAKAGSIVGGYRLGHADEIVATHGVDAIYSRSLYEFDEEYLQKLGSALELGRSFVLPAYQRRPEILDLLWRGIGRHLAMNEKYHTLFGAVSISRDHSDLARALISECMLEGFRAEQQYLHGIKSRQPLKVSGKVWDRSTLASIANISVLNKLVGRCDPGKVVPVLLRHYLSMNGRFICFSVNRNFNDSLDGLIYVDLRKTPYKYLKRYLGKDGAQRFLQRWSVK